MDKRRALILATWPMPQAVHRRMLVRPDLLLSQSHRGSIVETQAPRAPLLSRGDRSKNTVDGCESGASRSVRGRLEIEGLGARSSNDTGRCQ